MMLTPSLARMLSSRSVFPNQLSGVWISAMPQSLESSMKSRMLDDVMACASLIPVSRSGITTRSAPTFSSAFLRSSSVALQITCGTPRSFRFKVAMIQVAKSEPMATTAQSQLLAPSERRTSSSRASATTAQVTLDSMRCTLSGSVSMASTSFPSSYSRSATLEPNRPIPMTTYDFFIFYLLSGA